MRSAAVSLSTPDGGSRPANAACTVAMMSPSRSRDVQRLTVTAEASGAFDKFLDGGDRGIRLRAVRPATLRHVRPSATALAAKNGDPGLHQLNSVVRTGQVAGDADHQRGLAVRIVGDQHDDAGTELLLALVGDAAKVLGIDPAERFGQHLDAGDLLDIVAAGSGRAATHGQFLAGIRKIALEFLAFLKQRGDARRHLFQRYFKFCRRRFSGLKLFVSGLPRTLAGQSLDTAHPRRNTAISQNRNEADVAGAPHMRAAAKFHRPAERIAA